MKPCRPPDRMFQGAIARIVSFRRRMLATRVCLDEAPAPGIPALGQAIALLWA